MHGKGLPCYVFASRQRIAVLHNLQFLNKSAIFVLNSVF
jgi:hypothetical protein